MNDVDCDVCVVGAGISGLSVAAFLGELEPSWRVLVLERSARSGGAIDSFSDRGYLAEWGPHGFLDNCAESRDLIRLAGLEAERVTAPLGEFVRYLCLDGRLQVIPQKPLRILRQPLIPWHAKLRVLADLWRPVLAGEPTVAEWVAHRFGPALLPFADAVYTGTYAGDIERLRIDAVMPGVRELERRHGSVIRGVFRRMRAARAANRGEKRRLPAMTSFAGGMGALPARLAAGLTARGALQCENGVSGIAQEEGGWRVTAERGDCRCRRLVLALPVNQALELVRAALPDQPPPLAAVPEARILSVLLGFGAEARIPFGFGYLAPDACGRRTDQQGLRGSAPTDGPARPTPVRRGAAAVLGHPPVGGGLHRPARLARGGARPGRRPAGVRFRLDRHRYQRHGQGGAPGGRGGPCAGDGNGRAGGEGGLLLKKGRAAGVRGAAVCGAGYLSLALSRSICSRTEGWRAMSRVIALMA